MPTSAAWCASLWPGGATDVRHLVVGTAGHIDHGKSTLVRALTGIDPDRLKEEKQRGITIELGFADLRLSDDRVVSFVDVPGHERFVRHMVAGATGIDAVVLVIAADQGVQPQTREHLDICSLLGVECGVVALTKSDLVDAELLEVVELEVRDLLESTFLVDAPLIPVSAKDGLGLDRFREALTALYDRIPDRSTEGLTRLPVDRSFVMKGFGTVVTGTLTGGSLACGDEVEILPGGARGRVRGIQVHGERVDRALAGRRTAVNLQGLDCAEVPRGSTVTRPDTLVTSRKVWAVMRLLPDAPESLHKGGPVRFHQGTADCGARLRLLGNEDPSSLRVEIHLRQALALAPGDRFILRRPAPVDTVGGGLIVDVKPPRAREAVVEAFAPEALEPAQALIARAHRAATRGLSAAECAAELGRSVSEVDERLAVLTERGTLRVAGGRFFERSLWDSLLSAAMDLVRAHHRSHPLQPGIARETLRGSIAPAMAQESWRELLAASERDGLLRLAGEAVADRDHRATLDEADERLAEQIRALYRAAGLEPPGWDELGLSVDLARAAPIVDWLIGRGELVRVQKDRLFHGEALADLKRRLRVHAAESKLIDVATFKSLAGVSRKNAIPLLEYLDGERITRRVGDKRQIIV